MSAGMFREGEGWRTGSGMGSHSLTSEDLVGVVAQRHGPSAAAGRPTDALACPY